MNRLIEQFLKDIGAIGSLPVYLFLMMFLFLLGERNLAYLMFLGMIIYYFFAVILRLVFFRERPRHESRKNIFEKIDASSFPSLHSWRMFFLMILFSVYFKSAYIFALFLVITFFVLYGRIYFKKHHISDIVFGAVFGIIQGLIFIVFLNLLKQ